MKRRSFIAALLGILVTPFAALGSQKSKNVRTYIFLVDLKLSGKGPGWKMEGANWTYDVYEHGKLIAKESAPKKISWCQTDPGERGFAKIVDGQVVLLEAWEKICATGF